MSEVGVSSVAYTYPKVKLVTSAVDKDLSDKYHILPGLGNFGDRYFGTEARDVEDDSSDDDLDEIDSGANADYGDSS